ncbi:MAG: DHHA1 domain-containing protein [Methanomicrobiales archaeon]|nr:DHHA1 domain-containing protein [Methanomicrobiales archaeon]MDI6876096.1 DHHA1 domain-containing protein [Methanomicrobiales archaeon]
MSLEDAAGSIAERLLAEEYVEVFAHHDADGIAAASILCEAMLRAGRRFRLRIRAEIAPPDIPQGVPALLCDLGSARGDLPDGVMVVDHHVPHFEGRLHLNPRLEGIDGDRELSSAGAAYLVADRMGDNRDLIGLVLLGILGDGQELAGMNRELVNEGIATGSIAPSRGLTLPGRDPVEQLAYATSPYLDGISGDADRAAALIARCSGDGGVDCLLSLLLLAISPGASLRAMQSVYGTVYELGREVVPDAHALCALVDACGKCGKSGLAASLCLRSNLGIKEAWEETLHYRSRVIGGVKSARKLEVPGAVYAVDDPLAASGVADVLARDLDQESVVVVLAETAEEIRLSARTPPGVSLDLEERVRELARELGGTGGGHRRRAGATVPARQREACLQRLGEAFSA